MITIAWDIDDVLNDLMRIWFEESWLLAHPDCRVTYQELTENPPHKILNIDKKKYLADLDRFRLSSQYVAMQPIAEVEQWFKQYGHRFRHVAITAVPACTVHASAAWLMQKFGKWIRGYYFVPSLREGESLPVYDANKQDVLRKLGYIDVFIDDSEYNLMGVEEMGIKSILFPKPWNKNNANVKETLTKLTEVVRGLTDD